MREILFRGKCTDTGNWYEGQYIALHKTTFCFIGNARRDAENEIHQIVFERMTDWNLPNRHLRVDVIPETVGQYTGLIDKNGKKIFEGDILKIARVSDSIGSYYYPPLAYPVNIVVKWDMCAWMWETLCKDKRYIHFPDAWCHYECEVIGNIHDNPELLKGGE
jgi:uncharacterized phage protein (TIGR01671 family)